MPRRVIAKRSSKYAGRRRAGGTRRLFGAYSGKVQWNAPGAGQGAISGNFARYNKRSGLPNTYFATLTYLEDQNLASGAAGVIGTTATYNLNSIYSPRSGGGHQPYEYDSWAALYTQYQVTRVDVVIRFYATSNNFNAAAVMIHPSSDSSTISAETVLLTGERPGGRNVMLMTEGIAVEKTIQYSFTPAEIDGYSPATNYADANRYAASFGGSPSAIPKLEIGLGNTDGTMSATMRYNILIRQHVKFVGRKALAQS